MTDATADHVYLDHGATTPARAEALAAMRPWLDPPAKFGNPSSKHAFGRAARDAVDTARARISAGLGCPPSAIHFTASGSEANTLAVLGLARARRRDAGKTHLVCSAIEHKSALDTVARLAELEGFSVSFVMPGEDGVVPADGLRDACTEDTALVALMHVNNETGVIQPVEAVAAHCRERRIPLHVDGVAALAKLPVDIAALGATTYAIAAHKIGGPAGVGVLAIDRLARLTPLIFGGEHEGGLRAGTENVPGIVGFAAALDAGLAAMDSAAVSTTARRDRLEAGIVAAIADVIVNGAGAARTAAVCNVAFAGLHGETLITDLDARGIAASAGAACSASDPKPSHVLTAMGVPPETALGALRLTLGPDTTDADIDRVLAVLPEVVAALR